MKPILIYDGRRRIQQAESARHLRDRLKKSGRTQLEVARGMRISAPYLCDLLNARRNWTEARALDFLSAL